MTGNTMVFGASTRRSEKWRVYRIRTANSTYELEVQGEVAGEARRCAVLTRVEPKEQAGQSFEDSAPRVGSAPLFDVSPMDWMGKSLCVGTAKTSEVQSVDFIKTSSGPTRTQQFPARVWTTGPAPAPAPARAEPPPPAFAPFPLGTVELLEAAAGALKSVCHRHDLKAAIADDAHLVKRYQLALAQCGLMLEAMERRRGDG
jgi:hypothetical protein